jgi:hypothetical protein
MNTHTANSRRIDILGNGNRSSDQEILAATLKRWRRTLGYCSILAAVPAMVIPHVQAARAGEANKPEAIVAERRARLRERLNLRFSTPALLKRQSAYRLPHQKDGSAMPAAVAGLDECPGRAIPGASYTAAAPYVDSGDTTGANDTVTRVFFNSFYYYYYSYDALGPDHVYSFTLTGRGPNPQIQVSTTSGTYRPLIYVLQDGASSACPTGTGNISHNLDAMTDSRWTVGSSTATLDKDQINYLPLNVPLHLFVDSARNDANGAGPYKIRMQDVTIARTASTNPIDSSEFFVRQHYLDFLNREPDPDGLGFWTREINMCGTDAGCIEAKRINVSAAYFLSIECQQTGFLVYRFYKASYGNLPGAPVPLRLNEFLPDTKQIVQGVVVNQSGWEQVLESNKQAFATEFVQRPRFTSAYPTSMSSEQFVNALFANAGVTPSADERSAAINEFSFAATTADVAARARALRRVAENSTLAQQEFNRAFVLMQYFGYFRRNPNDALDSDFQGYNFWLNKLNQFNGDYVGAEMVKAFLVSTEYRQRFEQ